MTSFKEIIAFISRSRRKSTIIFLLLVWTAIAISIYRYLNIAPEQYSTVDFDDNSKLDLAAIKKHKEEKYKKVKEALYDNKSIQLYSKHLHIEDERQIDGHSSVYDRIFADHDVNSVLENLSFNERCDLYFSRLYMDDPNWKLDPNVDTPLENRDHFKYKDFRNHKSQELKEELAKEKNVDVATIKKDDEFELRMKQKYEKFWASVQKYEQIVIDYVSHLRIFNKCYITMDDKVVRNKANSFINGQSRFIKELNRATNKQKTNVKNPFKPTEEEKRLRTDVFSSCSNLESRIYPWLSRTFPTYKRWNDEILLSPPDMSKYLKSAPKYVFEPSHKLAHNGKSKAGKIKSKLTNNNKDCFLQNFKNLSNGKGIVLSIGDKHVDEAVRLIRLLRALNNRYPIQVVYNGGLSDENIHQLNKAARETYNSLPESFKKVAQDFPPDYLDHKDNGLPKQELWFVNVANAITDQYKGKFGGFSNKFLANLFNSFEEYILVDADTVMMQNPDSFFKLKNYITEGAYFYKDRTAPHFRPTSDCTFFKKITPSLVDQAVFDIPILSKAELDIDFFSGMFYYMESGLVVINRNLHFNSILMMIQMNFFPLVHSRVYGDKEVFWLAFLTAGERFHFNEFYAAAIGEETPKEERIDKSNPKLVKAREICAAHPAHISGEDGKTLHWFNSGFQFCGQSKNVNYEKEFKEGKRFKWLKSIDQMKEFYKNPMKIRHAVIPPFKNKFETLCENIEGEPKESWKMDSRYCNSYLWCAYSRIGGKTSKGSDNTQIGKFIEFDTKSTQLFDYLGDIWIDNE